MKKYSEKEWKYELDLNVRMAARLIDHQAKDNASHDTTISSLSLASYNEIQI